MILNDKISSYEPMIYSVIKKLNILYDVDEFMQIGRLAVFEGLEKFDSTLAKCTESQFIYTLIRQRLIDAILKSSRHAERHVLVEDELLINYSYNDAYQLYSDTLKLLNEREQQWFLLAVDGFSLAEISTRLSLSLSTAKNIRRDARLKIRKLYYD